MKSCKHLISDCQYEYRFDQLGNKHGVKCIPKSHPLYAEFRIWQFIYNLRIYRTLCDTNSNVINEVDVTSEILKNENDRVKLFLHLYDINIINQSKLIDFFVKEKFINKKERSQYTWNYSPDKDYPCNEARFEILKALSQCSCNIELTPSYSIKKEQEKSTDNNNNDSIVSECDLWHILYSIHDKAELHKALLRFSRRKKLPLEFADIASKIKPFAQEYGAYSLKAIQKLLPLMRMGELWDEKDIDNNTLLRIQKLISGEFDENISNRAREKSIHLNHISDFKGLPLWLACYVVYNRHSESGESAKWNSPDDIRNFIKAFKQHSLRNPIVEQVIIETLRTVADIWEHFGTIDEIHLELGREMKNPADKRAKITKSIQENENTNLRIKRVLRDFLNPELQIDNVRPDSPYQQEIFKIYEEYILDNCDDSDETKEIHDIIAKYNQADTSKQPTLAEIKKYKLWLDQKYRSPYTGKIIPLAKLFTPAYEIEHIIPQSRFFDDSLSNKVICESEVNKLKDNMLAFEFISKHEGECVSTSMGDVRILSTEQYEKIVRDTFGKSHKTKLKLKKLLMLDIPDDFIARQLNDSRYISKYIKALLSNIVRDDDETEATSKHLIVCSGGTTDRLKKDWGINDKWNQIILPRFERLNSIYNTQCYTYTNSQGNKVPCLPLELSKGFNKKRIDHRHHAMDAIVIACTTRDHVNLINNLSALSSNKKNRYALQCKLRRMERVSFKQIVNGKEVTKTQDVAREFLLPWDTFPQDVYNALCNIIVSFKSTQRIINTSSNKYVCFIDGKKKFDYQRKGNMLVPRKPLHKDTFFGKVNLKRIKEANLNDVLASPHMIVDSSLKQLILGYISQGFDKKKIQTLLEEGGYNSKIQVYYFTDDSGIPMVATRKDLVSFFADVKDTPKALQKIESITDTGIQAILTNHLITEGNNPEVAFSPEGIDRMNQNITSLNNGKPHLPVKRVRYSEILGLKYPVGSIGNKGSKYVESAKDTNLFLAVYIDDSGKRRFQTIQLITVFSSLSQGLSPVPDVDEEGNRLLFYLSPHDLVYVPTTEEIENNRLELPLNPQRIYRTISLSKKQVFFVPASISKSIIESVESKKERAITGEMIKDICIPIKVDRLGNITSIFKL